MSQLEAGEDLIEIDTERFGREVVVGHHGLADLPMFSDDGLVQLVDCVPRTAITAMTSTDQPGRFSYVDVGDTSGAVLIDIIRRGRLWMNLQKLETFSPEFKDVMAGLDRWFRRSFPGQAVEPLFGRLLLSSVGTSVAYHADPEPNMLLHLRGTKAVWVYPPLDPSFIAVPAMERIFAGTADEQLPYEPGFDARASKVVLEPGTAVAWPLNSPHRIESVDGVNASISVSWYTPAARRRGAVWAANGYWRERLRRDRWSTAEHGVGAAAKVWSYRIAKRLVPQGAEPKRAPEHVIDPQTETGCRPVASARRTP